MYTEFTARGVKINPEALLSREFYEILSGDTVSDAIFADSSYTNVIGVAGLPLKACDYGTLKINLWHHGLKVL